MDNYLFQARKQRIFVPWRIYTVNHIPYVADNLRLRRFAMMCDVEDKKRLVIHGVDPINPPSPADTAFADSHSAGATPSACHCKPEHGRPHIKDTRHIRVHRHPVTTQFPCPRLRLAILSQDAYLFPKRLDLRSAIHPQKLAPFSRRAIPRSSTVLSRARAMKASNKKMVSSQ